VGRGERRTAHGKAGEQKRGGERRTGKSGGSQDMLDLVKRFFVKREGDRTSGDKGRSDYDIQVATCALLLEMSNIDGVFSREERERIVSIMKKEYRLTHEEVERLIHEADRSLKESVDLWQLTNLINQNYTEPERIRVVELIWEIAYTDGNLDQHEDYLVHKLANLLRMTHRQLIDTKLRVKARHTKG
jgi:uncharacterized tellurite resistance protein B-like protein